MKSVLGLLSFVLLVTAAMTASKCGKRSLRSKYGKSTNFQSLEDQKSRCKYRIKSAPGLHIKLILDNYFPEPCCLKVKAKKKTGGKKAINVQIPAGPRASFVVDASDVDLIIITSPTARPVTISHEAVIPADGDFGFQFRANKKPMTLRSPGFPKTKLPSGLRSVWNVTIKRGEAIRMDITGFATSSGQDFLEIFDGAESIGRHSGKKKRKLLPITHRALSGNMIIILQTQTKKSKGFRAKFVAEKVEESNAKPAVPAESDRNLQCHKRTRIMSGTSTMSDNYSGMTCGAGELCGRMFMRGSSSAGGINLSITSEMMHCIPRNLCTGSCPDVPQADQSITVQSCELTCCSTDMCNRSPDGPELPPPTSETPAAFPFWPTPPDGVRCYEESDVRRETGVGLGSGSGGHICPKESVCALYVFSGDANDSAGGKAVGYAAKCTSQANCSEAGCNNIYETKDINIGSCNVTCCKTEYCNNPNTVTIPSLPPSEPPAVKTCLYIESEQIGNVTVRDMQYNVDCTEQENRCLRVDAYVKDSSGRHGVAAFGKCISRSSCDNLNCSSFLGSGDSITATSCVAECCSSDACNEWPLEKPIPTDEETGLWCHSESAIVQESAIRHSGKKSNLLCNDGEVCAYFKFYGTSTEYSQIGEPMAGYGAMCQPESACNDNTCQILPVAKDVNVTSCEATCCRTNMCNEPGEPPNPSPRTPVEGFTSQCYRLLQTSINGVYTTNQKSPMTCNSGSVCVRIDADTMHSGLDVSISYGTCVPKVACSFQTCDTVASVVPSAISLQNCRTRCCETNLCNGEPIPITTASSLQISPSMPPASSGSAGDGESQKTQRCYNITQMKSFGVLLPGSTKEIVTCEPNSQCLKISSISTHSSLAGVKVETIKGSCELRSTCAAKSCTSTISSMPGTVIESCEASCCDGDLCNI